MAAPQSSASIRVELAPYSMMSGTPAYQVQVQLDTGPETIAVFGLKRDTVVPDASDILFTTPTRGQGRLDLISQKFFGTPELWWVIAQCNPGLDPLTGPGAAEVIRIPAQARLATLGILNV